MSLDVSVVVPVFNAGVNLDGCMRSLLAQTLAPARYEILLVDDGSTDGTSADIDGWAAVDPSRVRVFHEPHSGWPGRPRNIGIEHARGDYIHFVDSDDMLAPHALERVLSAARASRADIVLPKSASDFRGVNHDLYRHNVAETTWLQTPLVESLVPHKLVRREFLHEHGLRFADHPRHVEDQLFFVHAYAHARVVAIVADEVCYYFRRRRGFGRNLGDVPAEPDDYYRDLEDVLDIVDRHAVDEAHRLRLYERFYRVEVLGRLRDRAMLDYDVDYRERLFGRVRSLVRDRMPPELDDGLPPLVRRQTGFVRAGDLAGLLAYARDLSSLVAHAHVTALCWDDGRLRVDLDAGLTWPAGGLISTDVTADVVAVGRGDSATWFQPATLEMTGAGEGADIRGRLVVDPRTMLFGRPPSPGLWDLRLRVRVGGLTRTVRLAAYDGLRETPRVCLFHGEPGSVLPYWTAAGGLALDVGGWSHSVSERAAHDAIPDDDGWLLPGVVAAAPGRRPVDVFESHEDGMVRRRGATLQLRAQGSRLTVARSGSSAAGPVWLRIGAPGTSAPAPLP